MKKPLTSSSGIMQDSCFKWADAADFPHKFICLESFSEKDKAIIMRVANINAARAAAACYGINISIDGEDRAKREYKELITRPEAAACPPSSK